MRTMTAEGAERQAQAGLPPEFLNNLVMMFDGATRALVLHFGLQRAGLRVPFLFVRGAPASAYASVLDMIGADTLRSLDPRAQESDVVGVETPVLGRNGELYFLLQRHRPGRGGTILSIVKLALGSNAFEFWVPQRDVTYACTPVELIGADAEGVFAKTGFQVPEGKGFGVQYSVAHFAWAQRTVARLTPLNDVFFR